MGTKMYTHTSRLRGNVSRNVGIAFAIATTILLSGCFLPDEFDLKFDIPNSSEVSWTYDGNWRFFFAKYDPLKDKIPPKELTKLTKELGKIPGSTSVTHSGKNIWKQSISWKAKLRDAEGKPVPTTFPAAKKRSSYWLVRIVPEGENSVILTTVPAPKAKKLEGFVKMGYKSSGTFSINTTGTVEQISGPKLSKGWFDSSYSGTWNLFEGEPIKVRIKW
ncbi:MAG: hypothetical protein P8Y67_13010 [Alphaproteobacteria bacterium]